ncbi:MAG: hypothetical protein ACOCUL_02915 [Bacteroidota bacterium]
MKLCTLNLNKTVNQFIRKSLRKTQTLTSLNDKDNSGVFILEQETHKPLNVLQPDNNSFKIKIANNPPAEAFMFFPVGKGPDLNESYCFIAYKSNKVAGWAWLHKGLRIDAAKTFFLDKTGEYLWLGPDYVRPKYRGASLQKKLIRERLLFIKDNFTSEFRIVTIIGKKNYPSLRSYEFFNFKIKENNCL